MDARGARRTVRGRIGRGASLGAAVSVVALVATALLVGCGGSSARAERVVGFRVERALALREGGVVLAGVRVATGSGGRCGASQKQLEDFALVRIDADGSRSWAGELASSRTRARCAGEVDSLVEEAGGSVLLSGWLFKPSDSSFDDNSSQASAMARFAHGRLDKQFADDGMLETGEPSAKIALQPDGSIVAAGGRRYSTTGTTDNTFTPPDVRGLVGGIAALPAGRLAVSALLPRGMHVFEVRVFDQNGRLVQRAATSFAPVRPFGEADVLDAFAAPGALYVFGRWTDGASAGGYTHFLYRYDLEGDLDSHFGDAGRLLLGPRGPDVSVDQVAIDGAGRIVVVGAERDDARQLFVARYQSNGALDAAFGNHGIRLLSLSPATTRGDARTAIAIARDGQIVAAGMIAGSRTRVFRLDGDGALAGSFTLP
jgi:hypothetical protein